MEIHKDVVTSAPAVGYVQWSAILAGAAIAAALSVVFISFASAIGLSFVSPWSDGRYSPRFLASIAAFFALAQQIGAVIAGAYVAGRLRSRIADTPDHEVEFRDGVHGGAVWAITVLITTVVLASAVGSIARGGADLAGRAAGAAASSSAVSSMDPLQYYTDVLLRESTGARPAPGGAVTVQNTGDSARVNAEMTRILARSIAAGSISTADKEYVATIVSRRSGIPQADAEKRVDQVFSDTRLAVKQAADKARQSAILAGFVTAAGLILSLGAGWWAGQRGGNHRDNSVPARFIAINQRRV